MKTHFRKFRRRLFEAAGGQCFYCGADLAWEGHDRTEGRDWLLLAVSSKMEAEHQDPLIRGGAHAKANVVASCKPCNSQKNSRTSEEFRFLLAFRNQRWPHRFHAEIGTPARDMLFVVSPDRIDALIRHNSRRPGISTRGKVRIDRRHETWTIRKQPLL